MYEVKALVAKNRLLIRMAGALTDADCREMGRLFQLELSRLQPGFDLINDIRELQAMPPFPHDIVERVGKQLRELGVRRVVRVVGRQAALAATMEKTSKALGLSAALAFSMEEAERVLDAR